MRMKWTFRDIGVISVFRYVFAVDLHHRDHKKQKEKAAISGNLFLIIYI